MAKVYRKKWTYDEVFERLSSLTQDYEYQSELIEDLRRTIKRQEDTIEEANDVPAKTIKKVSSKKTIFDRIDLG